MTEKEAQLVTSAVARCRLYPAQTRTENESVIALQADEIERLHADAERYRWLMAHPDECASVFADAYSGWDTEKPWREAVESEIAHRGYEIETGLRP